MTPTIEVFYSLRSPYCYFLTPRLLALETERRAALKIRPVYPIAIRDPAFFRRVDPLYRSYHLLDSQRVADDLGMPYRRPIPDPVVQNLDTGEIATEQPHIHRITRLCMAAVEVGRGLPFVHEVMTLIWSGHTDNWHEGTHLADAMTRAGVDTPVLEKRAAEDPTGLDAAIASNQTAQREAGHWGVPLMVLRGEPFYGQDRFSLLLSRLERNAHDASPRRS